MVVIFLGEAFLVVVVMMAPLLIVQCIQCVDMLSWIQIALSVDGSATFLEGAGA